MAIRCAVALLQPPLMRQKRFTLHEKQGKRRKPNIRHRVIHIRLRRESEKPAQTQRNPSKSDSNISIPQHSTEQPAENSYLGSSAFRTLVLR